MNVVDSSAWLGYLADGPNAGRFAAAIEDTQALIVPSICLYEAFKRVWTTRGESLALEVLAVMQQGQVVDLTADLAVASARLACIEKLAMADAVILATAREAGATLWTQDAHFQGKPKVVFAASQKGQDTKA